MSKKSFILMRDLLGTVDLMTDEEAGKILKAIINHVDGEPFDLPRELVFAFSPIKNQLDRDMSKYDNFVEKQRLNGLKGGRPKKANPNPENPSLILGTQAKPKNLVTVNDTDTDTDTENKEHKAMFNSFWENYPKKSDKKKAETAFNRLTNAKKEMAIIDCKTRYLKTDKKYIPLATTYIHGERWDDEIEKQEQTNHAGFEQRNYQAGATKPEELEWLKDD